MNKQENPPGLQIFSSHAVSVAAAAILLSRSSYLLFHVFAELFSIIISFGVFMIAWNSRNYMENDGFTYLGIAYLYVSFLDLLHTLSFEGMGIFPSDRFYANQLWIIARFLESISLLAFSLFAERIHKKTSPAIFGAYSAVTLLTVLSVFIWENFPPCYIRGVGQTPFKIYSEYAVCGILGLALVFLAKKRRGYDPFVYSCLFWSILITIFAELFFTLYLSNFGYQNLIGHLLKLASYFLIYKTIIETGIKRPFAIIFNRLAESEQRPSQATKRRPRCDTFTKGP